MKIQSRDIGNVAVLTVEGSLLQEDTDDFLSVLVNANNKGTVNIVIDFSDCSYITSSILSALFQYKKIFMALGGNIKVASINAITKDLFERTNLNQVLDIFQSVDSAVASFQ